MPPAAVKVQRQASFPDFYDVQSGSVTIGGVDVRNIEKQELMKRVAFVFQNTCLFKDTLLNNIKAAAGRYPGKKS